MKKLHLVTLGSLILVIGIATFVLASRSTASVTAADTHPNVLTNATAQRVSQVALDQVQKEFPIRSGTPQTVSTRSVVKDDLPKLGLGSIALSSIEQPPLMLVVMKGDFGPAAKPGASPTQTYQYVAYVYDLWAGTPVMTVASPDGGIFRTVLNDPSLPIVPTYPAPPSMPAMSPHHYGDTVPTFGVSTTKAATPVGSSNQPSLAKPSSVTATPRVNR